MFVGAKSASCVTPLRQKIEDKGWVFQTVPYHSYLLQDQPLLAGISEQVVALARKISNGSSRDLPPSYSKVRNYQKKIIKL